MKKSVKILAAVMSLILAFASISCGKTESVTTPESTAPITPSESTPVGGTPEASETEETPNDEPLAQKTTDELFAVIESYFEVSGDRNISVTVTQTVDGLSSAHESEAKLESIYSYDIAIKGYNTSNLSMLVNASESSTLLPKGSSEAIKTKYIDNYTFVDGSIYTRVDNNGEIIKVKGPSYYDNPIYVEEFVEEAEDLIEEIFSFDSSDFVNVTVEIVDKTYVLKAVGVSKEAFFETILEIGSDKASEYSDRFSFDPSEYTLTVVFDRNCRIKSAEVTYSYSETAEKNGQKLIDCSMEYKFRLENHFDYPMITAPADADEYLNYDEDGDNTVETEVPKITASATNPAETPEKTEAPKTSETPEKTEAPETSETPETVEPEASSETTSFGDSDSPADGFIGEEDSLE